MNQQSPKRPKGQISPVGIIIVFGSGFLVLLGLIALPGIIHIISQ